MRLIRDSFAGAETKQQSNRAPRFRAKKACKKIAQGVNGSRF